MGFLRQTERAATARLIVALGRCGTPALPMAVRRRPICVPPPTGGVRREEGSALGGFAAGGLLGGLLGGDDD